MGTDPVSAKVDFDAEINVRLTRPALAAGPLPFITDVRYVTAVFRETEAVSKGARHVVFRVSNTGASAHMELWEMFDIYRVRQVRVRALNGNGESGGWSAVRVFLDPLTPPMGVCINTKDCEFAP